MYAALLIFALVALVVATVAAIRSTLNFRHECAGPCRDCECQAFVADVVRPATPADWLDYRDGRI